MYKRLLVTVLVSVFVFSLWGKTETVCQSLEVEDSVPRFSEGYATGKREFGLPANQTYRTL